MKLDDLNTWADCDSAIEAIQQRRADIGSEREFRFTDDYCVGGFDNSYVKKEPQAMDHLRNKLSGNIDADGWEDLKKRAQDMGDGSFRFVVTRAGCLDSWLYVEPL